MITIEKEHEFDFGHRVWSQELDGEYSGSIDCKCKHLHGHRGKLIVELGSEVGLQRGMVTDFSHLKSFWNWVDKVFDHKFLVDINDPALGNHWLPVIAEYKQNIINDLDFKNKKMAFIGEIKDVDFPVTKSDLELYEGTSIVDFVPTAENICEWLSYRIQEYLPKNIICKSITFYETPKSKAVWKM